MVDSQTAPAPNRGLHRWAPPPLIVLVIAGSAGIVLDRYTPQPLLLWLLLAATALGFWFGLWRRGRIGWAGLLLCLAAASTAAAGHHVYWRAYPADELGRFAADTGRPVCLEATALRSPRPLPPRPPDPFTFIPSRDRTQLTVRVDRVRQGDHWQHASGRGTLWVDGLLPHVQAGDRVRILARLQRPSPARNPGEFDLRSHRRNQRELFELHSRFAAGVTVVRPGAWWSPRRALGRVRQACRAQLDAHLHARQAELAAAVLLGARDELSPDRVEEFFLTGTIHLLAISGLHIGILATGLWWLLRLLAVPRRTAVVAAALFVVSYALLVEARPPVVRAAILVVAFCLARLSGRRVATYNTLAAAALLLLAWNPTQLFQIGPQLSFLAVATLANLSGLKLFRPAEDPLARLLARTRSWPARLGHRLFASLGSLCLVSTAIWLVALPLVVYRFQLVSPVAVLLNPLIWLPMSIALFSGFGVLVFGWVCPPLATLCGRICNASLALLEGGVGWAGELPGGFLRLPPPAVGWVLGFYGLLGVFVAADRRIAPRWRLALLAAWLAAGCWLAYPQPRHAPELRATFVAVGHGAATLLEWPDGRTLLFDAGGMGVPTSVVRAISACLWSQGIRHLDAVVLSHAHTDHYNALPGLLERFSAGVVYVPPHMFDQPSEPVRALQQAIQRAGVEIRPLFQGQRLAVGPEVGVEVWHPPRDGIVGSENANSLVLGIEYAGARILLPADLESPGLEDLLAEEPQPWTLVTAPHHGSNLDEQARFAAWATPAWVVISGASATRTAAAQAAYQAHGAHVLHTGRDGAVRVTVRHGSLQVQHWRRQWRTVARDDPQAPLPPIAHRQSPAFTGRPEK